MKNQLYIPALRGVVGDWVYYSTLMNARQIQKHIVPSHHIREARALEDFLQRVLKPRVKKIARYLRVRDSRFFNSIIVGVFDALPNWAEFDLGNVVSSLRAEDASEIKESIGLLIFDGAEKMFAIDGQHRVEGIKAAYQEDPERLRPDQFSVIFVAHLDTPEGKVRTRRLFCDINKNAVAVSPGDKVVIDEDDLSAIVTRRIYAEYPKFKKGKLIAVSERKEVLAERGTERFTSLLALYTVSQKLKRLFHKQHGTRDLDAENVAQFQAIVAAFFDFVIENEPSLKSYFRRGRMSAASERQGNKNLLFRPVGLEVLARLYVHFCSRQRLQKLKEGLRIIKFENPGGIFDGVLWSHGRVLAGAKEKTAAVELCLYVLGELNRSESRELQDSLREITRNPKYKLPNRLWR
jgi:DNA sulfur modification protein DndB